jgi:hypothetical protein
MIRKLWQRLHAELALLRAEHERRKQLRFRRWQRKARVIMPAPKPDERSSIEAFQRIMSRPE